MIKWHGLSLISIYIFYIHSFPIAIKTLLAGDVFQVESIMDEAKSMFQIGTYHNHIVNLQGITCKENKSSNQQAPEVSVNSLYNGTILFFVSIHKIIFAHVPRIVSQ